jgi:hypothetical protein
MRNTWLPRKTFCRQNWQLQRVLAQPAVWNLEGGYNWDWGKNLEIAFKYSGSHEAENLHGEFVQ